MKIGDKVKLTNPEHGEEELIFVITNINEVTGIALIEWINSEWFVNPTELVSLKDIKTI